MARQFVERLARDRNIQLPGGDIFAETPAVKGKKGVAPPKKAAEPAKPAVSKARTESGKLQAALRALWDQTRPAEDDSETDW